MTLRAGKRLRPTPDYSDDGRQGGAAASTGTVTAVSNQNGRSAIDPSARGNRRTLDGVAPGRVVRPAINRTEPIQSSGPSVMTGHGLLLRHLA